MNIPAPIDNIFTIYSKSDCIYCKKVEILLNEYFGESSDENIHKNNCDLYLKDEKIKKSFMKFIENLANISPKTFPIVFYDGKFIGGFEDTKEYLKCKTLKFDEDF